MASAWELMAGGGTPQNSCEGITDQLLHTLFLSLCVSHVLARARGTHTSCHTDKKNPLFSFFPDSFLLFMPQQEGLQLKPSSDSSSRTLKMHLLGTTSLGQHSKGTLGVKKHQDTSSASSQDTLPAFQSRKDATGTQARHATQGGKGAGPFPGSFCFWSISVHLALLGCLSLTLLWMWRQKWFGCT